MLENGTVLNNTYRLIEKIGSGGGGIVYKAYHERLKKYVVVKEIKDCVKGILESRAEADILKNLSHTYLPQVFDFLEIEDKVYTVIDYIPGVSLEKALKQEGKFEQKEVLKWAGQLAQALAYLHGQNPPVIHSDIKPANIMLTPRRDICLIDFNISLVFDAGMRTLTGISPRYSPPEQYRNYNMYCSMSQTAGMREAAATGERQGRKVWQASDDEAVTQKMTVLKQAQDEDKTEYMNPATDEITQLMGRGVDERSDIYSLGATLYYLLNGFPPSDDFEQIIPISRCKTDISQGFAVIIEKMMEISPERRYQNGSELLNALQRIYELDSVYRSYHRKRRAAGAGLLGLYVLSAVLLVTGTAVRKREQKFAYNHEIEMASQSIEKQDFDRAGEYLASAIGRLPERADAYAKETERLYYMGDYEGCIRYGREAVNSPAYVVKTDGDKQNIGNIFYTMGNAYYELDDLTNADSCFSLALQYYPDNVYYYRDYSISLAKSGNLEQAEDMLEQAVSLGIGQDSLYMIQGEIAFAKKDYLKAVEQFEYTLNTASDTQMKNRCVMLISQAYQMMGTEYLDTEIQFLEKWRTALGSSAGMQILERLAEAYSQRGEYERALELFEGLKKQGYITYQMLNNQAVLYQQMGDLQQAGAVLESMLEQYPDRYKTYMRLAFLEADIQQNKANQDRDYHKMKDYYDKAVELYEKQDTADTEMQVLEALIQDAREGKWIN